MNRKHTPKAAPYYAHPGPAKVRRWEWRNKYDQRITEMGALLRRGCHEMFICGDDLRTVADTLHDIADELEAGQR